MAGSFTAVDLSRLPAPEVVANIPFEQIVSEMRADLVARYPAFSALVDSDPAFKVIDVAAYREMIVRQRVNDAARAVMVAYAAKGDLDNLGALVNVGRLTLVPADPIRNIPAVMEDDTDYRRRIVLAPEGFSVAGPEGAYVFHALGADADVLDASATSPAPSDIRAIIAATLAANGAPAALTAAMNAALDAATWPGEVIVTVLSRTGDGSASEALTAKVSASVSADDMRPMTDHVIVKGAEIVRYQIRAKAYTFAGPDSSVVLAESLRGLTAYVAECHRLGRDVTMSGLYAAGHVSGIQRIEFETPTATILADRTQACYCDPESIILEFGGMDE